MDPNPAPQRMRFITIPEGLQFTTWPQDPFVVLADPGAQGARLLASRYYGRLKDSELARVVGDELGWPVQQSSLFFAGGNLLSDERHVFVGAPVIAGNVQELKFSEDEVVDRFEQELGREVIVVNAPVAHLDLVVTPLGGGRMAVADSTRGAELAEQAMEMNPGGVSAFEQQAQEGFFGHPGLKKLTGPDGQELFAPELEGKTADAIADSREMGGALDEVAAQLEGHGYSILRIPILMTRLDRPEHRKQAGGSAGYPVLSYNNILVERLDDEEWVYLPEYGFEALDIGARETWEEAGYRIRLIPGPTTSAMYRGSLRCSVKVLARAG